MIAAGLVGDVTGTVGDLGAPISKEPTAHRFLTEYHPCWEAYA